MNQEHDRIFAALAQQIKALSPEQAQACAKRHAEHEDVGWTKPYALVAVELGFLSRRNAEKLIEMVNRKYPGKHPPLAPATVSPSEPIKQKPQAAATTKAMPAVATTKAMPPMKPPATATTKAMPPPAAPPPPPKPAPEPDPADMRTRIVPPKPQYSHPGLRDPVPAEARQETSAKPAPGAESAVTAIRRSSTRRHERETSVKPRPPARGRKVPTLALVAIGAAAVVLVVAMIFLSKGPAKIPGEPSTTAAKPAPPPEVQPPPLIELPKKKEEPPPPPTPQASPRQALEDRMAARRKKALEKLESARRELADERKAAEEAERKIRERLAGRSVTLTPKSGTPYANAVIRRYTFNDVEVETGGRTATIPWDTLAAASILAAADILYDAGNAEHQFERGRFLIARQFWKEARDAFQRAVKIDESLEAKVAKVGKDLDRVVSGQGSFRGSARRVGNDLLLLAYDFQGEAQLEDFSPGLALAGGQVVLESKERRLVTVHGGEDESIEFESDLDVVMQLSADGPVVFALFAAGARGYEIELGPDGTAIHKLDPSAQPAKRPLGKSDKVKLVKGKSHAVRIAAHDRVFTLHVDGQEALSVSSPAASPQEPSPRGAFHFGTAGGRLSLAPPLSLHGRLNPKDLDRRFREIEVLVLRAVNPDLEEVEYARGRREAARLVRVKVADLSADHPFFLDRIVTKKLQDLSLHEEVKRKVAEYLEFGRDREETREALDKMIVSYPDVPSILYLRALCHAAAQDSASARRDVEKALELFPEFPEAHALAARVKDADSEEKADLAALERALEGMPDYAPAYVTRAISSFARGATPVEKCIADLELAHKLDPENREAPTWLRILKYASKGPRDLGCRFDFESEHYRVTTDISAEAAKLYADRLETAHRHFVETFKPYYAPRPGAKPRVAVFNTPENYYTYFELLSEDRGEYTLGVFRPALNELVLFETAKLDDTLHTLYHEAFHQFTTHLVSHTLPYWFNEGMAEYMGALRIEGGKVVEKGLVLKERLAGLQVALLADYVLPFKRIMCETPREFYSGAVGLKYAQAWSMIHFFYDKHRELIMKYFEALRARKTPQQAFDETFGPKAEALEKEWKAYARALKP